MIVEKWSHKLLFVAWRRTRLVVSPLSTREGRNQRQLSGVVGCELSVYDIQQHVIPSDGSEFRTVICMVLIKFWTIAKNCWSDREMLSLLNDQITLKIWSRLQIWIKFLLNLYGSDRHFCLRTLVSYDWHSFVQLYLNKRRRIDVFYVKWERSLIRNLNWIRFSESKIHCHLVEDYQSSDRNSNFVFIIHRLLLHQNHLKLTARPEFRLNLSVFNVVSLHALEH